MGRAASWNARQFTDSGRNVHGWLLRRDGTFSRRNSARAGHGKDYGASHQRRETGSRHFSFFSGTFFRRCSARLITAALPDGQAGIFRKSNIGLAESAAIKHGPAIGLHFSRVLTVDAQSDAI